MAQTGSNLEMDRLFGKTPKIFVKRLQQLAYKMVLFVKCSILDNWLRFVLDNIPTLPDRMPDERSTKFFEFYGSVFLDRNVSFNLNIKLKLLIILAMVLEIAKNVILMRLPMSDPRRWLFCELLISLADDQQKFLNLIILLAMFSFIVYLMLLIRLDRRKLLSWTDFLVLEKRTVYAVKHDLELDSIKQLYLIFSIMVFLTKCASALYLVICYIFYARSLKLSIEKGISFQDFVVIFLPSSLVSLQTVSLYYSQSTKNCTLFIITNFFFSKKLQKLSEDLNRHKPKKKSLFHFDHLNRFQNFLSDFNDSQEYFNYSNFSFLAPLFATAVLYPYSILSDDTVTVNFLIASYSLNLLFAILPLFASTRFLNRSVSSSLWLGKCSKIYLI